jgi:hypothetical protein
MTDQLGRRCQSRVGLLGHTHSHGGRARAVDLPSRAFHLSQGPRGAAQSRGSRLGPGRYKVAVVSLAARALEQQDWKELDAVG